MPASGRMAAPRMRATLLSGNEVERKLLGAQSWTRAENKRLFGRNERCEQGRWESGLGSESVKRCEGVGGRPAGCGGASVMVSGGWSALIQTVTACRQQGELRPPLCIWLWAIVRSEASPGALLYTGKKINPTQVGPLHLTSNPGLFYSSLFPDVNQYGNINDRPIYL